MENYKKYTMDKADRMLQPAIGGELILLSYIGFSQEGRFEFLEKIDNWENRGDAEILEHTYFKKYLANDVFIITDNSYIKDEVYFMDINHVEPFVNSYLNKNSECFFNGDTFFISPSTKSLIEFQHDGYIFSHRLPIVINEHGKRVIARKV
ncbi:hypothetical protein ID850_05845 [Xenorhabdus sp. Flor]|uniref:hypothetical protein n=1 Tax=Xenorhabdus cabanillasii TaxID=351673 RepID=UPI0019870607|nr:hypothetical protein [Xenorhabdus sp. Flor]MBD2814296.1 hypothetical protein [Xenorhabdus sp. Flor]